VKNIKFNSVWGTYESLFTNMRNFRDSLQNKDYQQKWLELPEGHSWGLWRANIDFLLTYFFPKSVTEINEEKIITPNEIALLQNYPNPFNPITKIKWQSAVDSWQVLKVFDVLGNEVVTLVNEYKPAGTYEVEFSSIIGNGKLASGVYFYRLLAYPTNSEMGEFIETKKMLLIN
jgi:hypothetical protein